MAPTRRTAVTAGVLYLVTHVTSVAALALYTPVLHDTAYVTGPGADTRILLGAFLEGILALAVVGTAVTLYPVAKRHNESVALGYVGVRTLEAATIVAGLVSLLAVVTLRRDAAGFDPAALTTAGRALVAFHDWTFLIGPSFVLGVNTLLIASLMYRSALVPRFIGGLGIVGGVLIVASATAQLFGLFAQVSAWGAVTAVPVFGWELSFALWLVVKGFRPAALARLGS